MPIVRVRVEWRFKLPSRGNWLRGGVLYGSGQRLHECLRVRVNRIETGRRIIPVPNNKGGKYRVTAAVYPLTEPVRC